MRFHSHLVGLILAFTLVLPALVSAAEPKPKTDSSVRRVHAPPLAPAPELIPGGKSSNPSKNGAAKPKPAPATASPHKLNVSVLPTKLKVREFGGEFEKWTSAITINARDTLTFRWTAGPKHAASARWEVWDRSPVGASGGRPRIKGASPLASQPLSPVALSPRMFKIGFSFLPQWPPAAPGAYHYWVTIVTLDQNGEMLGGRAQPVKVTYRAAAPSMTFKSCPMVECGPGEYCRKRDSSCQPLVYTCAGDFRNPLIKGTDGSVHDCSPFICTVSTPGGLPHCAPNCASTADCKRGYGCDAEGGCVPQLH